MQDTGKMDSRGKKRKLSDADMEESGNTENTEEAPREIDIKGIDVAAAMQHHSGSMEDFIELLQLYCLEGKRKLKLLRELFEKGDFRNYEIEVHGLKSASANVGAMSLSGMQKSTRRRRRRGTRRLSRSILMRCMWNISNCLMILRLISART